MITDPNVSICQCGLTTSLNVKQWNVKEIKSTVDNKNIFGALSMDLSKTFGCLSYELVIANLNVYGFSLPAWRLVYDYLSNRQ